MVTPPRFSTQGPVVDDAKKSVAEEHRDLMCAMFKRTFGSYEVKDIAWPELAPEELARLCGMPFCKRSKPN
jgi:hypothetical protein